MPRESINRRKLDYTKLEDVAAECEKLLETGYEMSGKWTLGQNCRHLRLIQDRMIDGFPGWMSLFAPIRPILRWLMMPKLLRGDSPKGLPTAKMFIPPDDLDDVEEVKAFRQSVDRILSHEGEFKPHPGFGRLDRETMEAFLAAHACHHLGFLKPRETADNDTNAS